MSVWINTTNLFLEIKATKSVKFPLKNTTSFGQILQLFISLSFFKHMTDFNPIDILWKVSFWKKSF